MERSSNGLGSLADRKPGLTLAVAVIACVVVGAAGSIFTAAGLETWYGTLKRPGLAPPNWVFGPVWTTLFVLMGIAVWLVWRQAAAPNASAARIAIGVFVVHFAVNIGWSAAFFGAQSVSLGLLVILVLWLAIVATMAMFARVDRRAAALLVPYLLWVTFATYLNYGFWTLN
jgi:tryptophan-rich sensory protein